MVATSDIRAHACFPHVFCNMKRMSSALSVHPCMLTEHGVSMHSCYLHFSRSLSCQTSNRAPPQSGNGSNDTQ
jgi:hypothetical protein